MIKNKKSQFVSVIMTVVAVTIIIIIYIASQNKIHGDTNNVKIGAKAFHLQEGILQAESANAYLISNGKQALLDSIIRMSLAGGVYNKSCIVYRNATMLFASQDKENKHCFVPENNFTKELNIFLGLNYTFLKRYNDNILNYTRYNLLIINYPSLNIAPFSFHLKEDTKGIYHFISEKTFSENIFSKPSSSPTGPIVTISTQGGSPTSLPKALAFCPENANNGGQCELKSSAAEQLNKLIIALESKNTYIHINKTDKSQCIWFTIKNPNTIYYKEGISSEDNNIKAKVIKNEDVLSLFTKYGFTTPQLSGNNNNYYKSCTKIS